MGTLVRGLPIALKRSSERLTQSLVGSARLGSASESVDDAAPDEFRLMTLRSEGQFNTVVYEDHDLYRGQDRRDVILMNPADMARLRLARDDRVTVAGPAGRMTGVRVRPFEIRAGNAAMYYPEANVLVPATADLESRTPAFKHVRITLTRESSRRA